MNDLQSLPLEQVTFDKIYPVATFGTLRWGWNGQKAGGNHHLMKGYSAHKKAFLPHFIAESLAIHHKRNSCAPFEIFEYDEVNYNKMIPRVDALESFNPNRKQFDEYYYHRTLANLRVLPDDFNHELFNKIDLWRERDLDIPSSQWEQFPIMRCWIYSSIKENRLSLKYDDSPVIWMGTE